MKEFLMSLDPNNTTQMAAFAALIVITFIICAFLFSVLMVILEAIAEKLENDR